MRYITDPNVLSEATKPGPNGRVLRWLQHNEAEIVVDPVVVGELRFGILLLPHGRRRTRLERWFEDGMGRIHCLSWDAAFGMRWAQLLADLRSRGQAMPIKDSLIATSALTHGLTVVTRNVRDFARAEVDVLDPFE